MDDDRYFSDEDRKALESLEQAQKRIQDRARDEGRALNAVEARLDNEIKDDLKRLREKPQRPETMMHGPLGGGRNLEVSSGDVTLSSFGAVAKGRDFRAMFGYKPNERLDDGEFKSSAEFLRVFNSGRFDPRLQVRASMGEGIPSSGGFSVPPSFSSEWLDASLPNEIVRNLCRVYPMESDTLPIPGWDGSDMSAGATHGGLSMTFIAEGATATPQNPKMRRIELNAKMGAIYVDASIELIQDGKNFAANLETALQQSLGYGIDRYCLTGSGAGCPQGVLNAPCKIQITKETGQNRDTLQYGNLKKLFARQLNPGRAVWLFNPSSIPELLEQSVAVGTGGSFVPLLLPGGDGKFSIFGRPVYFHPAMPALGDADDSAFVDFNFYALGLRKEMWIDQTDAVRWLQRERSFRILLRFDGQCTLNSAITPENGDSLSPVVTLAERA